MSRKVPERLWGIPMQPDSCRLGMSIVGMLPDNGDWLVSSRSAIRNMTRDIGAVRKVSYDEEVRDAQRHNSSFMDKDSWDYMFRLPPEQREERGFDFMRVILVSELLAVLEGRGDDMTTVCLPTQIPQTELLKTTRAFPCSMDPFLVKPVLEPMDRMAGNLAVRAVRLHDGMTFQLLLPLDRYVCACIQPVPRPPALKALLPLPEPEPGTLPAGQRLAHLDSVVETYCTDIKQRTFTASVLRDLCVRATPVGTRPNGGGVVCKYLLADGSQVTGGGDLINAVNLLSIKLTRGLA